MLVCNELCSKPIPFHKVLINQIEHFHYIMQSFGFYLLLTSPLEIFSFFLVFRLLSNVVHNENEIKRRVFIPVITNAVLFFSAKVIKTAQSFGTFASS